MGNLVEDHADPVHALAEQMLAAGKRPTSIALEMLVEGFAMLRFKGASRQKVEDHVRGILDSLDKCTWIDVVEVKRG